MAATLYSSVSSSSLKLIRVSVLACKQIIGIPVSVWDRGSLGHGILDLKPRKTEPGFLWCLPPVSQSQCQHCLLESAPAFMWQSVKKHFPNPVLSTCYVEEKPPRPHVLMWHEFSHQTTPHPSSEASTGKPQLLLNQRNLENGASNVIFYYHL